MNEYNYGTFRRELMQECLHFTGGPPPGMPAPDFELPLVSGGRFRLSSLRGLRPVLLEFGSAT